VTCATSPGRWRTSCSNQYTDEPITCEWTFGATAEQDDRSLLEKDVVFRTEGGEVVVEASTTGLIRKAEPR